MKITYKLPLPFQKGLVIYGEKGSGKTWLAKTCLTLGFNLDEVLFIDGKEDVNDLLCTAVSRTTKMIIIDGLKGDISRFFWIISEFISVGFKFRRGTGTMTIYPKIVITTDAPIDTSLLDNSILRRFDFIELKK